jgi:uncharacterized protein (TIGR00251 family)
VSWIKATKDGVVLTLHIQPGAKKTEIVGLHGEALKIRLAAPPVDGKANEALLEFLVEKVGARRTALELVSGQTSRTKRVCIDGCSVEELRALLQAKAPS